MCECVYRFDREWIGKRFVHFNKIVHQTHYEYESNDEEVVVVDICIEMRSMETGWHPHPQLTS